MDEPKKDEPKKDEPKKDEPLPLPLSVMAGVVVYNNRYYLGLYLSPGGPPVVLPLDLADFLIGQMCAVLDFAGYSPPDTAEVPDVPEKPVANPKKSIH